MKMKKGLLGLVLVLSLFLGFGKVFAQTVQTVPNFIDIQNQYFLKKYGTSTYHTIPANLTTKYVFNGTVSTFTLGTPEWVQDQTEINTQYQATLTSYQSYVQSLVQQNNSLIDAKKAGDNNVQVSGNELTQDQQMITSLQSQVTSLQAQIATLKKQTCPIVKPTIITKTVTIPSTTVPVVTTPVETAPVPVASVETPAPVQKSFWQRLLFWRN